ncbi:hypothetical protein [Vibrio bivalvicida]|uniref:Transcription initiation factor TFIIIB n=1 Tax=Vibrio bivalvicida TaxID=1276888 RepID=A0A177Y4A8_9VIBR|nr:hypothetical protein [Vibrio bivalvicida]OAJ95718.1 hypothetical protein APB76_03215 [Vibrio bivalvicida]
MNKEEMLNDVLCCPLCGSEEYLLSDSNNMLCAECGSFFENVTQFIPISALSQRVGTLSSTHHNGSH